MVALPRDSAVTCPVLDTENTAPSEDAQVGVTPATGVPRTLTRAVSCCEVPTATDEVGAVTSTRSGTAAAIASSLRHALKLTSMAPTPIMWRKWDSEVPLIPEQFPSELVSI
jgi:hypothetical protein